MNFISPCLMTAALEVFSAAWEGLVAARRGLWHFAAAELKGDNAVDVLVFGGSTAEWDRVARDVRATIPDLEATYVPH